MGGCGQGGPLVLEGGASTSGHGAMKDQIEQVLQDARRLRADGRAGEAETAYLDARRLARAAKEEAALAHALRHLSDLARERGAAGEAWANASEAEQLYRGRGDRLGLANAVRLQALSAASEEEARTCWQEARGLYAELGVAAGVAECDARLRG
jgi:hypothetical protein